MTSDGSELGTKWASQAIVESTPGAEDRLVNDEEVAKVVALHRRGVRKEAVVGTLIVIALIAGYLRNEARWRADQVRSGRNTERLLLLNACEHSQAYAEGSVQYCAPIAQAQLQEW